MCTEVVPNKPWLQKLFTCAFQRMDAFNARDLSMFAWGMAKLGIMPPAAFLEVYVQRIEFMAGEFPPQEVANTVWALACFNVRPSSVLLVQLFDATDQRLSTFKASELSQLLWALADRRCAPDRQWLNEFFKVSFLRMPDFSPQGLSTIIWALDRLQVAPTPVGAAGYIIFRISGKGGDKAAKMVLQESINYCASQHQLLCITADSLQCISNPLNQIFRPKPLSPPSLSASGLALLLR